MKINFLLLFLAFAGVVPALAITESLDAGPVSCPTATPTAPVWGKLVVAGNSVTCFYGKGLTTPTNWTQIGKAQTINFVNSPLLVGMYVCSHNAATICTGTIDNFSISPASSYRLADTDIGSPQLMGSANLIHGVWTLSGCGSDIWLTSDQFNFQPWLVYGDCTIICRVTSISNGDGWQKVGIMIRDGYNSGSDYAMFCATGAAGVDFQSRQNYNNNPDVQQYVAPSAPGTISGISVGYSATGSTAYQLRP